MGRTRVHESYQMSKGFILSELAETRGQKPLQLKIECGITYNAVWRYDAMGGRSS